MKLITILAFLLTSLVFAVCLGKKWQRIIAITIASILVFYIANWIILVKLEAERVRFDVMHVKPAIELIEDIQRDLQDGKTEDALKCIKFVLEYKKEISAFPWMKSFNDIKKECK